jgi:hypothetical protein
MSYEIIRIRQPLLLPSLTRARLNVGSMIPYALVLLPSVLQAIILWDLLQDLALLVLPLTLVLQLICMLLSLALCAWCVVEMRRIKRMWRGMTKW